MSAQTLIVKEPISSTPRNKPTPKSAGIPVPFEYSPSDDGTDENLLILLHGLGIFPPPILHRSTLITHIGLGDTHKPFARLGKSLKLPQTATLALRAPEL